MNALSKIVLAVIATGGLSAARPALGNLMINGNADTSNFADWTMSAATSNAGVVADFPGIPSRSSNFEAFLRSPNFGNFSQTVGTMPGRTYIVNLSSPNVGKHEFHLNVFQVRAGGELEQGSLEMRLGSSSKRVPVKQRAPVPIAQSPKPVPYAPASRFPRGVSVPDGGSTVLLLGLALLGLAALRPRLSF
jgi:hypothetical protein